MQDGSDVIKGYAIKDYVTRGQLEDAGRERGREKERETGRDNEMKAYLPQPYIV